jgi:hypothetical protein
MSLLVIAVSVLSFTSSELRNARTVAVSSFLFLIVFYIATIYLSYEQSGLARKKLEKVIAYLEEHKKVNGAYPANLDALPGELTTTRLGVLPKRLNLYQHTDTTYQVGWDYDRRVYYDGAKKWWIDNMVK